MFWKGFSFIRNENIVQVYNEFGQVVRNVMVKLGAQSEQNSGMQSGMPSGIWRIWNVGVLEWVLECGDSGM